MKNHLSFTHRFRSGHTVTLTMDASSPAPIFDWPKGFPPRKAIFAEYPKFIRTSMQEVANALGRTIVYVIPAKKGQSIETFRPINIPSTSNT